MDISKDFKDNVFRVVVYIIAIYLILVNNSGWINMVGWVILFAHLYKDITQMECWPKWCEFVGLLLGIILIYNGYIIENYFIVVLGAMKTLAHIRQYMLEDNCYYY